GYDPEQLAHGVGVPLPVLEEWASGHRKPNLTQARKLASKLHRPFAALLLPAPPERRPLPVEFRHPIGDQRELNPSERRHLRRAARFQEILSWLAGELEIEKPQTPSATVDDDPAVVASVIRDVLRLPTNQQKGWATPSVAFDEWRAALEHAGHLVFLFSLGKDSCSGFSLWDDSAPVVAVNTAWNESARIFTLFHEMAHRCRRETPITLTLADGSLVEGVLDLAFLEKDAWTVVDFKTDRELEKELGHYKQQVGLYAQSIELATGQPCGGILMRV